MLRSHVHVWNETRLMFDYETFIIMNICLRSLRLPLSPPFKVCAKRALGMHLVRLFVRARVKIHGCSG